jgi:hypothetical protein
MDSSKKALIDHRMEAASRALRYVTRSEYFDENGKFAHANAAYKAVMDEYSDSLVAILADQACTTNRTVDMLKKNIETAEKSIERQKADTYYRETCQKWHLGARRQAKDLAHYRDLLTKAQAEWTMLNRITLRLGNDDEVWTLAGHLSYAYERDMAMSHDEAHACHKAAMAFEADVETDGNERHLKANMDNPVYKAAYDAAWLERYTVTSDGIWIRKSPSVVSS